MIVNAGGGGLGPMIVPNVKGRTITTDLMRDAVASIFRLQSRKGDAILSRFNTPMKVALYRYLYGTTPL